jgi:hypothetical protein
MVGIPLVFDANGDGVNDIVLINGSHTYAESPQTPDEFRIYAFLAGRR